MSPKKRPASSKPTGPSKKPSTNKESINSQVNAMRQGLGEEEPQEEEACEQTRDKMKAEKFARMRTNGQLPQYLITMFEEEAKTASQGARKFRTEIINKMFSKGKDGTWQLDTSDAIFQDYKAIWEKKYSKDRQEALPKSMVLGLYFQGNEARFNQSLADGEIEMVREEGGIKYYGYKKFTTGTVKGTTQRMEATGKKKSQNHDFHAIGEIFSKLKWTFKGVKPAESKQLEIGSLPPAMESLMKKASGACDKLSKDAVKLQKEMPDSKQKALKEGFKHMSTCLAVLDSMKNLLELPDGTKLNAPVFEKEMGDIANHVDKLNCLVEECRGYLKAQK